MKRTAIGLAWVFLAVATAVAGEVGFVEDFALAKDRAATLKQLIPGTEDYYYYHCLHFLNTGQYPQAVEMTRHWLTRFGMTQRLKEIQVRHALLTYEKNPQDSLNYLRHHLGLQYDHQRATLGAPPNLPTKLDPQLISRDKLKAHSFTHWRNLDNFENHALDWLAAENLNWERRRHLVSRLERPDVPNLPRLVLEDMIVPNHTVEFGGHTVHGLMTLPQLEELLKLRPDLLQHTALVQTWIRKLHPGADDDWRRDPKLARAYLDRLLAFVRRLAPVHNALKAHVLYHRLALDRAQGEYDRGLFLEYLSLPRHQHYMAKRLLEAQDSHRFPADLGANFHDVTLLTTVVADEPLVRDCLKHFLVRMESPKEFEPYINDVYLRHLFAEAKIEQGLGTPEQWASLLPPELFRQLKERIDIDFAPTNKTHFQADEPVALDLHIKNVPTLIVKVFEINTTHYYREHRQEVNTDINLDGLVANSEKTHTYTESPLRRTGQRFEFTELSKPGVYVIDFIGAGKSSRALIRKGRLRPLVQTSTAGQIVRVVDDGNRPVKDAVLWLGGQEYRAESDGAIVVPFSTSPGRQPIVLSHADFSCLDSLNHQPENYKLIAGIYVDRESLLPQRIAQLIVRPGLYLNEEPVSLKLLEEVKLRIVATDMDGISASTEVPNFKVFEDREAVHEFRVPSRLASLQVSLQAKVKNLSLSKQVDVADGQTFALNAIDKTDKIEDLHLAKFGANYVLELLGRTGEPKPDRPVRFALKHRDFKQHVDVTLKTDAQGRVHLGTLPDITNVTATGPENTTHTWPLPLDKHTYRQVIHAMAGEEVAIPYLGAFGGPTAAELALFELRNGVIQANRFDALSIRDGMLSIKGLEPGDYDLWLKDQNARIRLRIVAGVKRHGFVLGELRQMELPKLQHVQIAAITADAETLNIQLKEVSPFARVHILATRYEPEYSAFDHLGRVRDSELEGMYPAHAESVYLIGRNIGDEYRYVLDRRYQKKYPGNMLERPQLLLNPWAVRVTDSGEQMAEGGQDFGAAQPPPMASPAQKFAPGSGGRGSQRGQADLSSNLDFLADPAAVLLNLVPDKEGMVKVSRKTLGSHAMIRVIAVDPLSTTTRSYTLPEQPTKFLDLRLHEGLDAKSHFTQQKQISVLPAGQTFTLADIASSRFEAYDSLPRVYGLYATLTRNPHLMEFSFLMNWPKLKVEEKRQNYSKYACHELNFFLYCKDPEFFRTVIKPYLTNKKDKTFLDHWLLESDLQQFMQPWQFHRLNTVERILLAQRIAGELPKTARHLNELYKLLPPNPDRVRMLFETAVKGSELDRDDAAGFTKTRDELKKAAEDRRQFDAARDKADMPSDAAGMPGKGGGMGGGGGLGRPTAPQSAAKPQGETRAAGKEMQENLRREGRSRAIGGAKDEKSGIAGERLSLGVSANEAYFLEQERARRAVQQLYRKVEPTREWAENNYYHLLQQQQIADLVKVNAFWVDYAKHEGKRPFFSQHFAEASNNFTEMMFALSVLDLPFEPSKHAVAFKDGTMTFTPGSPAIAFHEEVKSVAGAKEQLPILVSQNFYKNGDRYKEEDGERQDKFITEEYLDHTVYGCQVVVTNPTSSRQKLSVLLQIPEGAMALANSQATRTLLLNLEPYRTQTVDYLFYFPKPGKFDHFPVHVAKNEKLVASADPVALAVVDKPSKIDTASWDYVSQFGTNEQVLAMLNRENLHALNLELIAFRMKDRDFFASALQLLQARHVYQHTLWSYGLYHNDTTVSRQFLTHMDSLVSDAGGPLDCPLLMIDPVARHLYEHLEYKPLVNARAHSLGARRQIVNDRIHAQYHHFLKQLSYHGELDDAKWLAVTYYLLLQDRIEEALAAFAKVHPEKIVTKLQYDYCAAYLEMFTDEPQKARAIAERHAKHPVDRWRNAFVAILHQLDEIEGKGAKVADSEDRNQQQTQLASKEPSFDFTLEGKQMNLTWQNLEAVRVNYYLMDVELLFSRNPFVQQSGSQFSAIRPNATQQVQLPEGKKTLAVTLPENLHKRNVLVEITAGGKTRSLPYYANAMTVQMNENYGQVRVTDQNSGKPLPKVYVKTYVRLASGEVKFHKDGYTDHRGRFDYAAVSTPERAPAQRFAVLILSDESGAQIREATPPQQ